MRVIVVRFHVQIKQDNDKASGQHSGAQYRNNLLWFTQAVETLPFELSQRHLFGIYVVNNNYEMIGVFILIIAGALLGRVFKRKNKKVDG